MDDVKGYKAFNKDSTNRYGKPFTEGGTYSIFGKLQFGNDGNGYHMCTSLCDVFRYVNAVEDDVLVETIINKEDISLTDVAAYEELLSNIFGMNIVTNSISSLVTVLVDEYVPFDLTEANLSSINYEEELKLIVDVVVLALEIVNSLDIQTITEAVDYGKVVYENILIDIENATNNFANKEYVDAVTVALNTVIDQLKAVDKSKVLELVETICDSQILISVALPIYNEIVYSGLKGQMAIIGDLSNYSGEALSEDLDTLLEIVENIYYSNIHTVITEKQLPGEECLPYLEEAVKLAKKVTKKAAITCGFFRYS